MSKPPRLFRRTLRSVLPWAFQAGLLVSPLLASNLLPPGFRPLPLGVHALVGGKIVTRPGEVLDGGTIVIRDGFITAVGKNIPPPADARAWDMKGMTIYAGFIDPYLVLSRHQFARFHP